MTVLHRVMVSGSDRSALQWRRDQAIKGTAGLELQHLYRAMGWLGEALEEPEPGAPSPRRTKDLIEEALFARRRDLFTGLDLVFFDTTSMFFTGDGGESLGQYGKSKDRRSDCKQMVLGMVIDGDGIPVCSEMWPGNTTDVTTLDWVAGRLQRRFGVRRVCLVADAGMMSKKMVAAVEARGWLFILGARLRRTTEVRDVVLGDTGPFDTVRGRAPAPRPDGTSGQGGHGRRPTGQGGCEGAASLCGVPQSGPGAQGRGHARANPRRARDEATQRRPQERGRQQGLQALPQGGERRLHRRPRQGPRRGAIRRHVGIAHQHRAERRRGGITLQATVDGRATLPHPRRVCSTPRPIFHKTDATICGHVFCSFLALVLRDELFRRMDNAGVSAEWNDILRDLNALSETTIAYHGKTFVVRSNAVGVAGKIAQCVGVRLPNTVRQIEMEDEHTDPGL